MGIVARDNHIFPTKKEFRRAASLARPNGFDMVYILLHDNKLIFAKECEKECPPPPRAMDSHWILIENHEKSRNSIRFQ